jgi:hypothetical protein
MDTPSADFLHPAKGIYKQAAKYGSNAPAFIAGSTLGAAIGTAILPGAGSIFGYLAGGMMATLGVESAVEVPWKMAELGKEFRRQHSFNGHFFDSFSAATIRKRSLQMIHESQMNARSALGNEAFGYHG